MHKNEVLYDSVWGGLHPISPKRKLVTITVTNGYWVYREDQPSRDRLRLLSDNTSTRGYNSLHVKTVCTGVLLAGIYVDYVY